MYVFGINELDLAGDDVLHAASGQRVWPNPLRNAVISNDSNMGTSSLSLELVHLGRMATPAHIREQVLALSEQERAELARDLILSLDGEADPDATKKWAEVIERRAREVLDGTAELVDGKTAIDRARARLKDRTR